MSAHTGLDMPRQGTHWEDRYKHHHECAVAKITKLRAERDALAARLPKIPLHERDCATLEEWRHRAMFLESQWSGCSA